MNLTKNSLCLGNGLYLMELSYAIRFLMHSKSQKFGYFEILLYFLKNNSAQIYNHSEEIFIRYPLDDLKVQNLELDTTGHRISQRIRLFLGTVYDCQFRVTVLETRSIVLRRFSIPTLSEAIWSVQKVLFILKQPFDAISTFEAHTKFELK